MLTNLLATTPRSRIKSFTVWALRGLWVLFALSAAAAHGQTSTGFNHATTGFLLDGIHARLQCEDCHKTGLPSRGLPKDCAGCHIQGGVRASTFQAATHIPNFPGQSCQDCHNQNNWTPALMRHSATMQGQCLRCHNGAFVSANATARPTTATHPITTASCDACHTTGAFLPVKGMVHDATTVGRCSTCHNGTTASGKLPTHIPTTLQCDTCHTSTVTWAGAQYLHDPSTWGRCSQCHNGTTAKGQPATHIPSNPTQCDSCHTNQITFTAVAMNHTGMTGKCSNCHGGAYVSQNAQTKPVTHVPTTAQCDSSGCHASTTTWAGVVYSHTAPGTIYAGNCSTCHVTGGAGLAKPALHIPTTLQCDTCHNNFVTFKPAAMNHTGTTGQCNACHNGSYASLNANPQGATHIVDARQCDTCHTSTVSWTPMAMNHTGLNGKCSTCHGGAFLSENAQTKPVTHVATNAQCDSSGCHASTTTWGGVAYSHTAPGTVYVANCSSCHYPGGAGLSKPTPHVPTNAQCDTCHTMPIGTLGSFRPAKMNHTGTTGQCSTCHDGTYLAQNALTKPATHVATSAQCDSSGCHASTTTWTGVIYSHTDPTKTYINNCSSCHSPAGPGLGQPATHIVDARQCDTCHKNYTAFKPAIMDHTGKTGQCSTCHGGQYLAQNALTKPTNHVPTTAQCDTSGCHASTTVWTGVIYSHTAPGTTYVGSCSTCHFPGGPGLSKPTPHVPTTSQCDTCHTNYTAFKPAQMNHTGTAGQCATCHSGTYTYANAQTKATGHIVDARACDTCHLNFVAFSPATMDHTGLNGKCSTCHSGAYLSENAQMKPTTHVATTAQCDSSGCHASTTTWAGTIYSHTDPTKTYIGNCSSCHASGPGLTKPTNHVPTTQQCDTCHTNFVAFKPAFMNHVATAGQCANCHNGSYVFAAADKQGTTHIPDARQCDTCHTSTVAWTSMLFVHPATAPANCSSCHSGQYLTENAQMKPATHTPTTAQCDTCHTSMTSWATGAAPDHTPYPPPVCSSCHFPGGSGLSKPATHIPVTVECNLCHNKYPAQFKPATMNHSQVTATGCSVCHSGTYAAVNALPQGSTHIPTAAQCNVCHTTSAGSGAGVSWLLRSMQHSVVTATACSTCHGGAYVSENALAKGTNHIPIGTVTCDKCHSSAAAAFSPATMDHTQVYPATTCATCHSGAYTSENAQGKPTSGHVTTALACNSSGCHSGYTTWVTQMYAHNQAGDSTKCGVSCHVSTATTTTTGLTKPAVHVPVPATATTCGVCHSTFPPVAGGFSIRPFTPHSPNSVTVAALCSTCHNATYAFTNANPQGVTHIPTTAQCDKCHTSTANWTTRTMDHTQVTATTCSTCHSGGYASENADAKGSTHIPTTAQCNGCHTSTVNWTTRTMNHTLVVATPCSTCHNGGYLTENAQAKGVTHVPETRECNVCHTSTTVWTQRTYVHPTNAVANCRSCHNGSYVSENALAEPAGTHIPYAANITGGASFNCDSCHTGYTTWTTGEKMNHNNTQGNGAGFCKNCHQTGTSYLGTMQRKSLTHQKSTGVTDCSQSGCHKPLGNTGSVYKSWS